MNIYGWGLLCSLVLFSCNVSNNDKTAEDLVQPASLPGTTVVQVIDSIYNFGSIVEGEKVSFNFRFKNIGSKPMLISGTSASCGCTVPEKPEKPILPGETSFIKVVFNSSNKVGYNEKNINVIANTNPSFPSLLIKGEVKAAR